ncbi:MAG: MFS transporter, partial [Actinomycetes bacterium]
MKRGREVVALMAVAASQRSALTSVPPQINAIRSDLHLSLSQFAALTSIPLILFGLAAPIGISKFARRKPTESAILFFIGTLVVALSLRAIFNSTALFLG